MRHMITGAAGFLGYNLTSNLLEQGKDIIALDSLSRGGSERNLSDLMEKSPNLDFRKLEVEEIPGIILLEKPDIVYHFAAQVAVTTSVENPIRDFKINGEGTSMIALAAKRLGIPVIYSSTNKVYGDNVNNIPILELPTRYNFKTNEGNKGYSNKGITEDFPVDASHHTPYGCSKLVGDIYVREAGGIVNRFSCMYGPNQHGIVDQGWLSYLASKKIKGEQITIFGDGKQVRDVLHVDDVVRLLQLQANDAENLRGEVFNIGGGYNNTISLLEICKKWDIEPKFDDWRPADQKVFYCDISKAESTLGWQPVVGIEEGLKDLYSWTEKNLSQHI